MIGRYTSFSIVLENGTGVSIEHARIIGASKNSKNSSAIIEEISAPMPPVKLSSCRIKTRFVFETDSKIPFLMLSQYL